MMKKVLYVSLIMLSFAACKGKKTGGDSGHSSAWKEDEVKAFKTECVKGAQVQMGEEKATKYCDCMLGKLETKFPNAVDAQKMTIEDMTSLAKDCIK